MMRKILNSVFCIALLTIILAAANANAATITYAVATGNWTDANWTPQAPVTGDNVVIPAGAVVTVNTDLTSAKFNSLSVSGSLTIENTGVLAIEQITSTNPLVGVGGGTLINNGTLSIKQTLANSNAAINLSNGTDADSRLINAGTLSVDMMASTIATASTRCIYLTQTTATRSPHLTLGGTMNFSVPNGTRFFELGSGANAVIDGNAVIGSTSDYKNWRLIHMGNGGTLTLAGSLEFYSGYISANGVISQSVTGTGSAVGTVVNSGTLKIHGMAGLSGSYAIYLNAQRSGISPNYTYGTAKFRNTGNLIIDGNYPTSYGAIYLNGNPGATDELKNEGALTVSNDGTGPAISCQIANVMTAAVINSSVMNLSSAGTKSIVMGDANSSLVNSGNIIVNKAVSGYVLNATAASISNNTNGVFSFNVADNSAAAIDGTNKIVFTNNGGTVNGRGIFGAGTFVPSTGTIAPGGAAIGAFTFADALLTLTGKLVMNATGTANAGVDYDQINSTGTLNIAETTLEFSADYTAQNADNLALITAASLTGTFSAITKPVNWAANYSPTNANLLYDTSTAVNNKPATAKIAVVRNAIIVSNPGNAYCSISDMAGRTVKSIVFNNQSDTFVINNLKGIYIIRISSEEGNFTQKVNL